MKSASSKSKPKASSEQDRLNKWKAHLKNLLGEAPVVSDSHVEVVIDRELDIKQGDFDIHCV